MSTHIVGLEMKRNKIRLPKFSIPSREEHFDFLLRCYFGEGRDPLRLCIDRAYLDFNRTLHGIAKNNNGDGLRNAATACLIKLLSGLSLKRIRTQSDFDKWHKSACDQLRQLYRSHGFTRFSIGQAQKWLNMALKYVFTFGQKRLPGFAKLYPFAHVPVDSVVLKCTRAHGGQPLSVPWSRLDDYATYLEFQKLFRQLFRGSVPLAAEFRLWLDDPTKGRSGPG